MEKIVADTAVPEQNKDNLCKNGVFYCESNIQMI